MHRIMVPEVVAESRRLGTQGFSFGIKARETS